MFIDWFIDKINYLEYVYDMYMFISYVQILENNLNIQNMTMTS